MAKIAIVNKNKKNIKKKKNVKTLLKNVSQATRFKPQYENPECDSVTIRNCLNRYGFFILRAQVVLKI